MENLIESLIQSFEKGKMNRRQLVRSLAVAASAAPVVSSVPAVAAGGPLPVTRLDHLSYTVADYAKTRDFYSGLLGMKVLDDDGKRQARLSTGNTVIVARTGSSGKPTGLIDHIGYGVDLKDKTAIFAEIKKRGFTPEPMQDRETGVHVRDPDGFNVQLDPLSVGPTLLKTQANRTKK
jgi:catechol 2,3-dioxygenase-like lactoylglutathione lyase family enzyme